MERRILCRSPRGRQNRIILRVIIALSGSVILPLCTVQPIHAIEPPTVVIEDTVTLGVGVKTVELDTTHFGEPSLLVGTLKNGGGDAFVLRVRTNLLEVAETLYTCQSVPLLVRAGRLDADEHPDLLVSLQAFCPNDSPSYTSVVLHGPDYQTADTLCFRSYLRDAIIDDATHEVWLAYVHDSVTSGETFVNATTVGSALRRDSINLDATEDTLLRSRGGVEIRSIDVNLDGATEIVVFWNRLDYSSCWEVHCPDRWLIYYGPLVSSKSSDTLLFQTWLQEGLNYDVPPWASVMLDVSSPIGIGDLDEDGYPDAALAWFTTRDYFYWGRGSYGVTVRSLSTGAVKWTKLLPNSWSDHAPSAVLWDLNQNGPTDMLVGQRYPTDTTVRPWLFVNGVWGLEGSTGDSLFYFEAPCVFDPVVVGSLDNSGIRKGVLVRGDTLFVFHLDFTPNGVDDHESVTPAAFELLPNHPNPFNAQTLIEYDVNRPTHLALSVYDVLGRFVRTLVDGRQAPGLHTANWDGRNSDGEPVSSGVYFYRMKSGDADQVRKMLLLK